jgi:ABC-type transporter Mla maintaining outer membrane lipid asymmetry ATPase subunit MlaF
MGQVSLRGVHKRFGSVDVIRGVDLDVIDGEFLVFVGTSGCGTSTRRRRTPRSTRPSPCSMRLSVPSCGAIRTSPPA